MFLKQETEEFSYQAPEMTATMVMNVLNLTSFQLNAPPVVLDLLQVRQILKHIFRGFHFSAA